MKNQQEREAELVKAQEKLKQEAIAKWRVEDQLNLPEEFGTSVCFHHRDPGECKPYVSVAVLTATHGGGIPVRQALELIQRFHDEGTILMVPRWRTPGFSPVWMPDDCNHSRLNPGAEQVGEAQVELTSLGSARFRCRELAFWIRLCDVDEEAAEINLNLSHLPSSWECRPNFKGFSTIDGACTSVTLGAPEGLPGAYVRVGNVLGSRDSWRAETYWGTTEEFISQLLEAGIPAC